MKSFSIKIFSALFCLAFTACNTFAQDSNLKQEFQKKNNEMIEAMLNDNTEAMLDMYTDDAISLPSYEPMLRGKAAMIESHNRNKDAGFKMNDMTLNTMEVWSSGNYAYEIGTYTIDISMPQMENWKDNGKYLTVWEKQSDGLWKVKADTWNTDNNPWQDMNMTEDEKKN